MNDGLVMFVVASLIVGLSGLMNAVGKGSIVSDCKAVGVFHVNGEVFDCKLRVKND